MTKHKKLSKYKTLSADIYVDDNEEPINEQSTNDKSNEDKNKTKTNEEPENKYNINKLRHPVKAYIKAIEFFFYNK